MNHKKATVLNTVSQKNTSKSFKNRNYSFISLQKRKNQSRRRLLQTAFLVLSISCLAMTAYGSESIGTLQGYVINKATKQPIPDASVLVVGKLLVATTDKEGFFKFENVPAGKCMIKITALNFRQLVKLDITVNPRQVTTGSFELEYLAGENVVDTVNVVADYFSTGDSFAVSSINLSFADLRNTPGVSDMFRRLQSVPGVLGTGASSPYLIVRGGAPDQNLTLIDNIEVYSPYHFTDLGSAGGGISVITPQLIEETDFSAGGFGVEYGDKLSSVTHFHIRTPYGEETGGEAWLDFGGGGLLIEGPLGSKASYLISAKRGIYDLLTSMRDNNDVEPHTWDFYSKIALRTFKNHSLSFVGVYATDTFTGTKEAKNTGMDYDIFQESENEFGSFGINWTWLYSDKGFLEVTPFVYYNGGNRNYGPDKSSPDENGNDFNESHYGIKTKLTYLFSKSFEIITGGSFKVISPYYLQWGAEETLNNGTVIPAYNVELSIEDSHKLSYYLQSSVQLLESLEVTAGIRYDYFDFTEEVCTSPRFSLSYYVSDSTRLNLAYGIFYQYPAYYQISLSDANNDLVAERAEHYIAGVDHLFAPDLKLTIEAYYKNLSNLLIEENEKSRIYINSGEGYSTGFEVGLIKKLSGNLFFSASYAHSETMVKDYQDGGYYDYDYYSPHVFNLLATYRPSDTWQFGLAFRYFTGLPYTPYDLSTLRQEANGNWFVEDGLKNSERYPDYQRLDLRIDKKFIFENWVLEIYVDIWNLYNHDNIIRYTYSDDYTEKTPSTIFSLMPMFGIKVEF